MSRRALALTPAEARSSPPDRPEDDLPTRSVLAAAALAPAPAEAPAGQPASDGADLPTRRARAAAALGVLIAAAFLALAVGLGLLISSVIYGYGGLG